MVKVNKRDLDSQIIEQIDAIIKEYDNVLSENKEKIGLDISAYYYFVSRFESIIGSLPKKESTVHLQDHHERYRRLPREPTPGIKAPKRSC